MSSTAASPAPASRPRRLTRRRKLLMGAGVVVVILALAEGALRLAGFPSGTFRGAFTTTTGLWEPQFSGDLEFGPYTYHVQANAHGFRGPELRTGLKAARTRIVCLGDSVTDGFYVDNDATYPHFLQEDLLKRGRDVEVINAARAGGSVNKACIVLRDICAPLAPDAAVLLFVTNDLADLGMRSVDQLMHVQLSGSSRRSAAEWLVTRTALGEGLLDGWLRLRFTNYRGESREAGASDSPRLNLDERYAIIGNDRYEDNARLFLEKWGDVDGRLYQDPLDTQVLAQFENYCAVLRILAEECRARDIRLLFAYFPAYPEIYLRDTPATLRDLLRRRVEALGVPFLDLTMALRDGTREGPLHLAPVDFHPNPRGNRVIARAVAEELLRLDWAP